MGVGTAISRRPEPVVSAEITRCGYVALIGAPNTGKSTLLNQLVGRKLAIVTPKVQTTRTRLLGIAIAGSAQLILVDTPGIFEPRRRLDRAMVAAAWAGAADADRVVLLVDAARPDEPDTRRIIEQLKASGRRAVLALNKIDLVRRDTLLGIADAMFGAGCFDEVFMISALNGDGVERPQAPSRRRDAARPVAVSRGSAIRRARALARCRGDARTGFSAAA